MSTSDQASSQDIEFSGSSSVLPADLVRALVWLRSHLSGPVQLETLAQIAGVRPRTLETHFKLFLGTTPLGWVRRADYDDVGVWDGMTGWFTKAALTHCDVVARSRYAGIFRDWLAVATSSD